jgi:hypothetical protein
MMRNRFRTAFSIAAAMTVALVQQGCGKCGDTPTERQSEVATATPDTPAAAAPGAATATDVAPAARPEPEGIDAAARDRILTALLALEVPDMGRSRAQRNNDTVLLQFDRLKANDSGNIGTVEVSAGFCVGCAPDAKIDESARREQIKTELGDLHAGNPDLVIEFGEFELAPERKGQQVYRRSFVIKDEARVAVHTLGVDFFEADRVVRLLAYPRTGFPDSAEAFDKQYTRADLEADLKRVFVAIWPVLWPQTMP